MSWIIGCTVTGSVITCVPSVSVCDHGGQRGRKHFDFHFFLLGLHIAPLRQQPINETSRSFPEKKMLTVRLHTNTHAFFALFCVEGTRRHTGAPRTTVQRHTSRGALAHSRPEFQISCFFDWFDLVLTVCVHACVAAARRGNIIELCATTMSSAPSPWITCSLCLHAPPPYVPSSPFLVPVLCSCADQMADTLMGPLLSNGAGLEFDTLTPPITAARHQEPHRMLSGKCLHCLLEFLWWL